MLSWARIPFVIILCQLIQRSRPGGIQPFVLLVHPTIKLRTPWLTLCPRSPKRFLSAGISTPIRTPILDPACFRPETVCIRFADDLTINCVWPSVTWLMGSLVTLKPSQTVWWFADGLQTVWWAWFYMGRWMGFTWVVGWGGMGFNGHGSMGMGRG